MDNPRKGSDIAAAKGTIREQKSELDAMYEELALLRRRNTQMMGLLMALMVLHGQRISDEHYRMTVPYAAARKVPTQDFVLTNRPNPDTNEIRLELRRRGLTEREENQI